MYLRLSLIAALAAGCYSPSIAPCLYACDNDDCPAGLTCMANMCTNAETGLCTEGDGGIDVPGGTTHVTIEVRNLNDNPYAMATVIFTDAAGNSVAPDATTDGAGMASADVPVHSNVTIVRGGAGTDLGVTTFVDIWPDAHLVSQFDHAQLGNATVTVNWPTDGSSLHRVFASCGATKTQNGVVTSTTIDIPRECTSYDILVIAGSGTTTKSGMVMGSSAATVTVTLGSPTSFVPTFLHQPPVSDAQMLLGVNAYQSAARALTTPFITGIDIGITQPVVVPAAAKLMLQLDGTVAVAGVPWTQRYFERIGTPGTYMHDLDSTFMEWMGPVAGDLTQRKVTWPATKPPTLLVAAPSMVFAGVFYRRGQQNIGWHIIGPPSMITPTGNNREFVLPAFAANLPFEPLATDTAVSANVETYRVSPAAAELPVRSYLEQRRTGLDVWDIVGLTSVAVAKTQ